MEMDINISALAENIVRKHAPTFAPYTPQPLPDSTETAPIYRAALALAPDDPKILNNLAFAMLYGGGELMTALRHADKAAMFDTIDTSKDGFIDAAEHKAHKEGKCGEGKCGEGKCGGSI